MPKLKYSDELKLKVIHYLMEGHSLLEAEKEFHIGKQNIQKWRDAYELHGVNGIRIKQSKHNKYTGDFKVHVIEYKQMHQLSARQTAVVLCQEKVQIKYAFFRAELPCQSFSFFI